MAFTKHSVAKSVYAPSIISLLKINQLNAHESLFPFQKKMMD